MERGFTLVEIAIVVLVLGLLLGSLLGPLSVRIEQQEIRKTSEQLEEIKEALYGYAMEKGALPCPDTNGNGDGLADPPIATLANQCNDFEGWLPFQTLGVPPGDAWGFRFRYRVTPEFTISDNDHDNCLANGDLDLCTLGNINVETQYYDRNSPLDKTLAGKVPAVILSHGKNGLGATRTSSTCIPPVTPGPPAGPDCMPSAPDNTDEQKNADPDDPLPLAFVSRHYSPVAVPCNDDVAAAAYCQFDDIVLWLSANVLKYRLVQAGRLP